MFWNVCCSASWVFVAFCGPEVISPFLKFFVVLFQCSKQDTLEDLWEVRPCFSSLSIEAFQLVLTSSPCCPSLQIYISHIHNTCILYLFSYAKCYSGKSLISSPLLRKKFQYVIYWLAQYKCAHLASSSCWDNHTECEFRVSCIHLAPWTTHRRTTFLLDFSWRFCLQLISLRNVLTLPFTNPQCKEDKALLTI